MAFASDHAGFVLKRELIARLSDGGHELVDLGTDSERPVDYPDFADALGQHVRGGRAERGVLICGSGAGAAIAANKLDGVRAALAHDAYTAHQAVEHDDANILALGARVVGTMLALELVRTFLGARFSGEERHRRRLRKIEQLEQRE